MQAVWRTNTEVGKKGTKSKEKKVLNLAMQDYLICRARSHHLPYELSIVQIIMSQSHFKVRSTGVFEVISEYLCFVSRYDGSNGVSIMS